jgi:hypothetical protein
VGNSRRAAWENVQRKLRAADIAWHAAALSHVSAVEARGNSDGDGEIEASTEGALPPRAAAW